MDNTPSSTKNADTFALSMPSDTEVVITRVFGVPREKVWKVINDPALVSQWWGPRGSTTTVDMMDVRVGGKWRYISDTVAFNGIYKEIVPMERVTQTFEFEPMPGHILTQTMTLEDKGEKTLMIVRAVYANKADRDGMVASGMEGGSRQTYDRLEELLATR